MTRSNPATPAQFHAGIAEKLGQSGHAPDTVAALLALDAAQFQWHRLIVKGELPGVLLAELDAGLDPSHFSGLTAVLRLESGVGRAQPEPATIGALAEEMAVDPSRASRIASDLIARGLLRREAAQDDGRKSILRLTGRADILMARFRDAKWARIMRIFDGWSAEEIRQFATLFGRYFDGLRDVFDRD